MSRPLSGGGYWPWAVPMSLASRFPRRSNTQPVNVLLALNEPLADGGLFILPDGKDGKVIVPADKIGYVEFSGVEQRRVGFGSL